MKKIFICGLLVALSLGLWSCGSNEIQSSLESSIEESSEGDGSVFDVTESEFGTVIENGKILCIPTPIKVQLFEETTVLNTGDVVGYSSDEYLPAVNNFILYLEETCGIKLTARKNADNAKIVLKYNEKLETEEYKIIIKDTITLEVSCPDGACRVFATMLQYIGENIQSEEDESCTMKNLRVYDKPDKEYRGLMLDTARSFHSVDLIKQMIRECYLYKTNYLHIHFTDTVYFTFPWSFVEDELDILNCYTKEQLIELEEYAAAHGVTIIPEVDIPAHQGPLIRWYPEIFTSSDIEKSRPEICIGKEEVYEKIDELIGEMSEIFKRTPYIHMGIDELGYDVWETCETCKEYRKEHNIYGNGNNGNAREHIRHFINRLSEMAKERGKKLAIWESFAKDGIIEVDKDVVVYAFQSYYNLAPDLIAGGYTIINCATEPLYYVPYYVTAYPGTIDLDDIYDWDVYLWKCQWDGSPAFGDGIRVEPTDQVIGAQLCCWETAAHTVYGALKDRIPIVSERVWNLEKQGSYENYTARYEKIRLLAEKICVE